MRLSNYEFLDNENKIKYLDSLKVDVGLKYFGGKRFIARYLINHIFNMAICMKNNGKTPDLLIDAFVGGGKIGLSIPKGFFNKIVLNDINYGVYSYFKCAKDSPKELIYAIDYLGKYISRDLFYTFLLIRDNKKLDPLLAGALTYWGTASSYNGILDPNHAFYNLTRLDNNKTFDKNIEQDNIKKIIKNAFDKIPKLSEKLNENYIIENLDYRELIKKYNGLEYKDLQGNCHIEEKYKNENKLWYLDPPYHPYTVYAGAGAIYLDSFDLETANEMTKILHGDYEDEYGALEYFIKSDYDPIEAYKLAKDNVNKTDNKDQKEWYEKTIHMEENSKELSTLFSCLEQEPFKKIYIGEFDKGSLIGTRDELVKNSAKEFIWCRGFDEKYCVI